MSIVQFNQLPSEESELLLQAPALVTCLIAGAENTINEEEEERSKNLIHIRTSIGDPLLFDFYKAIESSFETELISLENKYGSMPVEQRTEILIAELKKLNTILPKIDNIYARAYLKSLRTLAHSVAESSGGVFGFLTISYKEHQLIGLEMITYQP